MNNSNKEIFHSGPISENIMILEDNSDHSCFQDDRRTDFELTIQIEKKLLPIYQQAAELEDVNLVVIANEGKTFDIENYYDSRKNIIVSRNNVAIRLNREPRSLGMQDFWEAVKLIEAELPNTRIG